MVLWAFIFVHTIIYDGLKTLKKGCHGYKIYVYEIKVVQILAAYMMRLIWKPIQLSTKWFWKTVIKSKLHSLVPFHEATLVLILFWETQDSIWPASQQRIIHPFWHANNKLSHFFSLFSIKFGFSYLTVDISKHFRRNGIKE